MLELMALIWEIALTAVSEWFLDTDLRILIYLALIACCVCYLIKIIYDLRKF